MCMFKKPKIEQPPVIAKAPEAPDKPPEPVEIKKDKTARTQRRKNPLRIDRDSGNGGKPASGVSV